MGVPAHLMFSIDKLYYFEQDDDCEARELERLRTTLTVAPSAMVSPGLHHLQL